MKTESFSSSLRLKKKEQIAKLFSSRRSKGKAPLRLLIHSSEGEGELKVLVAVPKRKLKKAVERNKMKRLIREAFRKNKGHLEELILRSSHNFSLGILFNSNKLESYSRIEEALIFLLKQAENDMKKDVS